MWLAKTVGQFPKAQLIRTNSKDHGCPNIVPTSGASSRIDGAAVGNQPRFDWTARRAEHDGVLTKIGIDVTQWRQQPGKEFVTRPVCLAQCCFAPEIKFRIEDLFQFRQRLLVG